MDRIIEEWLFRFRDRRRRRPQVYRRFTWHRSKPYVELWLTILFILLMIAAIINFIVLWQKSM